MIFYYDPQDEMMSCYFQEDNQVWEAKYDWDGERRFFWYTRGRLSKSRQLEILAKIADGQMKSMLYSNMLVKKPTRKKAVKKSK